MFSPEDHTAKSENLVSFCRFIMNKSSSLFFRLLSSVPATVQHCTSDHQVNLVDVIRKHSKSGLIVPFVIIKLLFLKG